jgi:septal ring factor EnvC (AmiA/AmiB activator)
MNTSPKLYLFCFLLAVSGLCYSQESASAPEPLQAISSINGGLDQLENLISDTLSKNEHLSKQLHLLRQNLAERETLLQTREALLSEREALIGRQAQSLTDLQRQLEESAQIYREQSELSAKYENRSRFWRLISLAGIPAAAVLSAGITALVILAQ